MVLLWSEQALQLDSLYWNVGSALTVTLGLLDCSRRLLICNKGVTIVLTLEV